MGFTRCPSCDKNITQKEFKQGTPNIRGTQEVKISRMHFFQEIVIDHLPCGKYCSRCGNIAINKRCSRGFDSNGASCYRIRSDRTAGDRRFWMKAGNAELRSLAVIYIL